MDDDDHDTAAKRRPWGPDEDEHLRQLVQVYGIKSWAQIATRLNNRNGKQCRERWRNHLRPELNKGDWSAQEDVDIWERVQEMGTKWAQVSRRPACAAAPPNPSFQLLLCAQTSTHCCFVRCTDLGDVHAAAHRQ